MFVLLDSVANVERLSGMNMLEMFGEVERNSVEHFARCFVDKFEFYMFQVLTDEFACAEVRNIACAENGFLIARSEWVEAFE